MPLSGKKLLVDKFTGRRVIGVVYTEAPKKDAAQVRYCDVIFTAFGPLKQLLMFGHLSKD
jgi:hypothetical protein